MIPLHDSVPSRTVPVVNFLLIGASIGVFLFQVTLGGSGDAFVWRYGFVPARLFHPSLFPGFGLSTALATLVTSVFLHGGFLHLAGNMLYLWIFGDNVEDELGHCRFVVFFLAAGVLAALLQGVLSPSQEIPMVGASGAIAGVLGAYFVLHPRAKIATLVPLFLLFPIVEIPAGLYILLWFLVQFWMGTSSLASAQGGAAGGVAWWAHVGGFLGGLLLLALLRPRRRPSARYSIT